MAAKGAVAAEFVLEGFCPAVKTVQQTAYTAGLSAGTRLFV